MSSAPPAARCDRTIAAGCNALRTFCAATTAAAADICEPQCQSLTLMMADTKPCTSARSGPRGSRLFALRCSGVFDEQLMQHYRRHPFTILFAHRHVAVSRFQCHEGVPSLKPLRCPLPHRLNPSRSDHENGCNTPQPRAAAHEMTVQLSNALFDAAAAHRILQSAWYRCFLLFIAALQCVQSVNYRSRRAHMLSVESALHDAALFLGMRCLLYSVESPDSPSLPRSSCRILLIIASVNRPQFVLGDFDFPAFTLIAQDAAVAQ